MMHSYKPGESSSARIFVRARQFVAAAAMLLALTLAGPPRLWGQCSNQNPSYVGASLTVSPGSVTGGDGTILTATITLNGVAGPYPFEAQGFYWIDEVSGPSLGSDYANIWTCTNSTTIHFTVPVVSEPQAGVFHVGGLNGAGTLTASFQINPVGHKTSPGNQGVCPSGQSCVAGHPINITNGNVYIPQRDYSVPGLGGGLELSRVWNSRWMTSSPPTLAGMFGSGWRSTYEEQLMLVDTGTMIYWRGDGSGWTFTYNSVLSSYSISSPPDVRAQLVSNVGGGFTLTLPGGTQKVFNGQNLLASIVDRNGNQTTLAYDWANRLTSVTSAGGSTLGFTYGDSNNPMQVTSVQDSVGTVATYTYDSSSRLTSVTYADTSGYNFAYDPNNPPLIISVTDKQSKVIEAHTYDSQDFGRGLTSTRAYGVDSVSLTY